MGSREVWCVDEGLGLVTLALKFANAGVVALLFAPMQPAGADSVLSRTATYEIRTVTDGYKTWTSKAYQGVLRIDRVSPTTALATFGDKCGVVRWKIPATTTSDTTRPCTDSATVLRKLVAEGAKLTEVASGLRMQHAPRSVTFRPSTAKVPVGPWRLVSGYDKYAGRVMAFSSGSLQVLDDCTRATAPLGIAEGLLVLGPGTALALWCEGMEVFGALTQDGEAFRISIDSTTMTWRFPNNQVLTFAVVRGS